MLEFDPTTARDLSRLASAAYDIVPFGMPFGDTQLGHLGNIFQDDENVIVAYRGSRLPWNVSTLPNLIASGDDWLNVNFNFAQTAALGGKVHRGFWERSNRTWTDLLAWVRQNRRGRRLWITGHSMGGALAVLAGQRFIDAGIGPTGVYAFGAPMVGDAAFAERYAAPLFCVENQHDIIPHLPFDGSLIDWLPGALARRLARFAVGDGFAAVGEVQWIMPNGEVAQYGGTLLERGIRFGSLVANLERWVTDHCVTKHVRALGGEAAGK